MTADLIAFLRARLDEDEAKAKDAPWELDEGRWPFWIDTDDEHDAELAEQYRDHYRPSRMLREVEAKRRIIDEYEREPEPGEDDEAFFTRHGRRAGLYFAMLMAALPYADHPDYESWRS